MSLSSQGKKQQVVACVYDIANCGPRNRFWANGKLVSNCNLQNLNRPLYDDGGKELPGTGRLRKSILAPPDHVVVVCDSGQIECRLNNWMWDQLDMLDAFRQYDKTKDRNSDPYRIQATRMYGVPIEEVTKGQRFIGKICELMLGYQAGAPRLRSTLELGVMGPATACSDDESRAYVTVYRNSHDKIVDGWACAKGILVEMLNERDGRWKCIEWDGKDKTIWLPNGLGLHYYGLTGVPDQHRSEWSEFFYRERQKAVKTYGGKLVENIIQALGRVVVAKQLLDINGRFKELRKTKRDIARCVHMTHDEVVGVVHKRYAERAMEIMHEEMRRPPAWALDLPLSSEGGFDVRYSK